MKYVRKANTIQYHLHVETKIWQKWTYLQIRKRLTDLENRLVVAKGQGRGSGIDRDLGVSRCKLLHLEWISNEVLLYSTGNCVQTLGGRTWQMIVWEKLCVCMYACVCIYIYTYIYIYIYIYIWITMLCSGNWHTLNQLYSNSKKITNIHSK